MRGITGADWCGLLVAILACAGCRKPDAVVPTSPARVAGPASSQEPAPLELAGELDPLDPQPGEVDLWGTQPLRLAPPPDRHTLRREAPITGPRRRPRLVKVSAKRNQITDDDAWFARNGLSRPAAGPGASEGLPARFAGSPLSRVILHQDHTVLLYGTHLVVAGKDGSARAAFDFAAYPQARKARWAEAVGSVLFIAHAHRTYADSTRGKNAFITALDLDSGDLLWRSAPLVANADNFVLHQGFVLTGYGFTSEPDFVFVLDQKTGKTISRVKVKSGPEFLAIKGGRLYVRTYDRDYVFALR